MIKIKGLKKFYPLDKGYRELLFHPFRHKFKTALNGIDLEVKTGECFFLLGPNGAGKTTLIKLLATLLLPDEGQVYIKGMDVAQQPAKVKEVVGYAINEERSFYWRLTGRQNLEFYAALNNLSIKTMYQKIDDVLKITRLTQSADRRFSTYSAGMKQMLSIARALLCDPEILFVDEPTKSLDPLAAQKIRCFLKEELVKKRGHTIVWSSHDLKEVEEFGDSLAIMDQGKIRIKGTVSQVIGGQAVPLEEIYKKVIET